MPPVPRHTKNVVQIGPEGNALIRGIVTSVVTNSVTLSSWGGAWTINVGADTKVMPKSTSTALAWIRPGDFVSVNGKIDTVQPWTINARVVHDTDAERTLAMMQKQMRMRLKEAEAQAREKIKQMRKTSKEEIKDLRKKEQEQRRQLRGQDDQ